MRPNLSVENIAGALAVLGTSVLMAACGGDKPANTPVNSSETPTAGGDAKPADGHCGADKEHKAGDSSCGAKPTDTAADAKPAETAEAPASTTPAPAAAPDTKAADAKPADAKADAKKPDAKKPAAAPAAKKGGAASCGAGTCASKK